MTAFDLLPALRAMGTAALCGVVLVACGGDGDEGPQVTATPPVSRAEPTPTSLPESTGAPSSTSAPEVTPETASAPVPDVGGLWAAEDDNELLGLTMFLTPGGSPGDAWAIDLNAVSFVCAATETEMAWLLEGCSGNAGATIDSLSIPKAPGEAADLAFTAQGRTYVTTLRRIEDRPDEAPRQGVERLWIVPPSEACPSSLGIWAEDGLVFGACSEGTVQIFEAATGRLLSQASTAGAAGGPSTVLEVTYRDGLLFAATVNAGLVIFDVSDPRSPRLAGQFVVPAPRGSGEALTNVHNLTLSLDGRIIFLINQSHPGTDVRAVDVSAPAAPFEVGRYMFPGNANVLNGGHDLYLTTRGGRTYAYLNRLRSGLEVLDVTDPAAMTKVGSLLLPATVSHSGWFFEVDGHHYFAHTDEGFDQGMTVLNVDDVASPEVVSTYRSRPGISIHNMRVHDGIAYIAYYVDGLRVVDLRDPANPVEIAHYDTLPPEEERSLFSGAWGVDLDGGLIFVSDMDTGVYGLRLTEEP
jgi:choice-of-anchor B domain-containing protein